MICCFTGHRSYKLGLNTEGKKKLKLVLFDSIKKLVEERGVNVFYTGMAEGVDLWAAQCVQELKWKHDLTLIPAIPFVGQEDRWNQADKILYHDILDKCNEKVVLADKYYDRCLLKRNEYMVDRSDILLAVYNGNGGGTGYTVNYAKQSGKEIILIDPKSI